MKYYILISFIFLQTTIRIYAQQSAIRGIVSIHNSETFTGKRIYLSNAQVEDDFKKATPTITGDDGQFKLIFVGLDNGKSVSFDVKKPGLQVVDNTKLTAVAGQNAIIQISMANPDSITSYKIKLYNIGKSEAQKALERKFRQINGQINILKKNEQINTTKIKELETQLLLLENQKQGIDDQATELARKYSPINLDDAGPVFKQAFVLFQSGFLDPSLSILQNAQLNNTVEKIVEEAVKLQNLKKEITVRDSIQQNRIQNASSALLLKADLHKTKFAFDSADVCYKLLLKLEPANPEYLFSYAHFLQWQNRFDSSIQLYRKTLDIYQELAKNAPLIYDPSIAKIQGNLGIMYWEINDFPNAENADLNALEIFARLCKTNAQMFEPDLSIAQNNLGTLYRFRNDYTKAENFYLSALEIRQRLAKDNPQLFEVYLAETQNDLADVYQAENDFAKAENLYLNALEIRQRLAKSSPQIFESYLAQTNSSLGTLNWKKNDFTKAESEFLTALEIYQRLAKNNPQRFEPGLADIQNNLGNLYLAKNDLQKAENAYLVSMEINRRLEINNPAAYEPGFAETQNNLGLLYLAKNEFSKAEKAFQLALETRTRLSKQDPALYIPDLKLTETLLARLYGAESWHLITTSDFKKAEQKANAALAIAPAEDWIKANLAHALLFQGRFTEAMKIYSALKHMKDDDGKSFATICLEDLDNLAKKNITHKDVRRIRSFLTE